MGNALHPNERTLIYMLRKILVALGKTIVSLILIALLAIFVTSVSPVYDFSEAKPFSGPDIFNPYRGGVNPTYAGNEPIFIRIRA